MINDPVLINDWHPVASESELEAKNILGIQLLGEDLVVWHVKGQPLAWQDLCIHRGTRLSLGKVRDEMLQCPFKNLYLTFVSPFGYAGNFCTFGGAASAQCQPVFKQETNRICAFGRNE